MGLDVEHRLRVGRHTGWATLSWRVGEIRGEIGGDRGRGGGGAELESGGDRSWRVWGCRGTGRGDVSWTGERALGTKGEAAG